MALDLTTVTQQLFSQASSSEQVGAIAAGAKDITASTFPMWGTAAAIILFPLLIGVVLWIVSKAKKHGPKA